MSRIAGKITHIRTVKELISALQTFPEDMPVKHGFDNECTVYKVVPEKGEFFDDERGEIAIEGEDPWHE